MLFELSGRHILALNLLDYYQDYDMIERSVGRFLCVPYRVFSYALKGWRECVHGFRYDLVCDGIEDEDCCENGVRMMFISTGRTTVRVRVPCVQYSTG